MSDIRGGDHLDITSNPLIALYFACEDPLTEADGEVVVFKVPKKEIRYHDSDTVAILSNLSRQPINFSIADSSGMSDLNEQKDIKNLLHEIRRDKPYFSSGIERKSIESVVFVKPKLDNSRIIKQDGAFLLFGIDGEKSTPAKIKDEYVPCKNKIIIDFKKKRDILFELGALGVSKMSIFPEIDKVAEHLRDFYSQEYGIPLSAVVTQSILGS